MKLAWVLWDLIALGVLIYFVSLCAKRGLIRTVINFVGYSLAALLSSNMAPVCASWLYENLVHDALRITVEKRAAELVGGAATMQVSDILGAMPRWLVRIMEESDELAGLVEQVAAGDLVDAVIRLTLAQPVQAILQALCFLVLFGLMSWVVRRAAGLFSGLHRVPLVGSLNTLLGGVVGVLEAVLFLYISGFLLELVILASGGGWAFLNPQVLHDTYIYRVFLHFTP